MACACLLQVVAGCASGQRDAGVDPNSRYSFWPPVPDEPRVQFLRSFALSSQVERPRGAFDRIVFGAQSRVLPIGKPYGVAMWNGRIYVCDIVNPGVVILDLVEHETRIMVTRGVEAMAQPTDIAIAADGMKYVIDRRLGRIFVFDAEDRHVLTFGERDLVPAGVAVYGDDLYVSDFGTQSILVIDRRTGETKRSIGAPGGGPGQFIRPVGLCIDAAGNIYVSDAVRGRVQKFSPQGELLETIGEIGDTPGSFVRPKSVAVDADDVIYVVDAAFQNVQMFDAAGQVLMFFGSPGAHAGSMSLPAGIAVSSEGVELFADDIHPAFEARQLVLVTNQFGLNKVSVYAMGGLKPGRTIADIAPHAAQISRGMEEAPPDGDLLRGEVEPPPDSSDKDRE